MYDIWVARCNVDTHNYVINVALKDGAPTKFKVMLFLITRLSLAGRLYLNKRCGWIGNFLRWLHFKCTAERQWQQIILAMCSAGNKQ